LIIHFEEINTCIIALIPFCILWLPFALMQKVPQKNKGYIHPWLKINVSAGRKPERCAQTIVSDFID
jgi:hypothetical protein